MTQEQREKIAETMGALWMASANCSDKDTADMMAGYAEGLAELLNGETYTINADNVI